MSTKFREITLPDAYPSCREAGDRLIVMDYGQVGSGEEAICVQALVRGEYASVYLNRRQARELGTRLLEWADGTSPAAPDPDWLEGSVRA